MNDFQPLGCGLGRAHTPPAAEADPPSTETATMAKHEELTDKIIRLIGEAGGELAGADLRDQLGADESERRTAIATLRKSGRISSTGAPRSVVYRVEDGTQPPVAGHRIPNPKKPAKVAKKAGKTKVAKLAKDLQVVIDKPLAVSQPITLHAELEATLIDTQPIAHHHLFRVLTIALSRPGDMPDLDRQALHAVAMELSR